MGVPAILASGVSKYFGDFPALRDVTVEVSPGSVLAMLGRNGAGKTTLLRILAGLTAATKGSVSFPASSGRIGMIGHGTWLYDDLTAEENLRFFGRLYGVRRAGQAVDTWLDRVGLTSFRRSRVCEYSRGMRQRLTIARAFLHEPDILLLDEPWTALDDRAVALLSELVRDAKQSGRAAVVCSHQLREAAAVADTAALLHRGRLVFHGPVDDSLRADPQAIYRQIR